MPEIDRLLADNEGVLYVSRKHPSGLYRRGLVLLVAVAIALLAGLLFNPLTGADPVDLVVGVIVGLIALRFLLAVLKWRSEHVALTRKRVIVTSGLFRKQVTSLPVRQIRNITVIRTLGARMQLFGDVLIDMGETGLIEIRRVARVKRFHALLVQQIGGGPDPLPRQDLRDALPSDPDDDDTGEIPTVVL